MSLTHTQLEILDLALTWYEFELTGQRNANFEAAIRQAFYIEKDLRLDGAADWFIPGLGTIRVCLDCGCLVAGGPTRCQRCVKEKWTRWDKFVIGTTNWLLKHDINTRFPRLYQLWPWVILPGRLGFRHWFRWAFLDR